MHMAEGSVVFKATVNGLILIMREEDDFESVLDQIEKKLASAGKFFKGASISVKYRGKKLTKDEEDRISGLMALKTGAEIKSFAEDLSGPSGIRDNEYDDFTGKMQLKMMHFKGINEGMTKFHRGTVRSGQLVSYDGNLVVIGDVNPGGELRAAGNVVVIGSLRGIVHAGADGNKEAVVVALNLNPTQLRIADVITRSPDENGPKSLCNPELAYVKDNMVYIESFLR